MPEQSQEDGLDLALKSPETYIDNDDFSRRVMRSLPPKRRRSRISPRKQVITASTLFGLVCSISLMPPFTSLPVISVVTASQWFPTIATMAFLGVVAFATWWLASDAVRG